MAYVNRLINRPLSLWKREFINQEIWTRVNDYFAGLFSQEDDILKTVLRNSSVEDLPPPYNVSPCQGKFLQLLIEIQNSNDDKVRGVRKYCQGLSENS
jgi:hypothetical protein